MSRAVQRMVRWVRRLVLAVVVLAAVGALGVGIAWWAGMFGEKIEPGQRPAAVAARERLEGYEIDQVHPVEQVYYAEAVGTLKAASRTQISARVMAEIKRIHVRAGDIVEEGQVVIELDRAALERRLSQAQATLAAAEAALTQAKTEYDRANRLAKAEPGAITDQQLTQTEYAYQSARARREGAQEAVAEAEVLLSYTRITAPKKGMIVERYAEEGDVAQPGVPLLELYDPTSLRLEVPVMENLAIKLKPGDQLTVKIDALDRQFTATVDEIVPQAEAASRSFMVKVKLPPSPDLFEGMYGRLLIPAGMRRHLCLNARAVERIGQLEFVYVVDRNGKNPERRFIKTGRYGRPDRLEVLSGLKADEYVLVRPKVSDKSTPSKTEG